MTEPNPIPAFLKRIAGILAVLAAVFVVTWLYINVLPQVNALTVGFTYLLVVLISASSLGFVPGIFSSVSAMLCLNYFFLPPRGTLTIEDPQNWVALSVFLVVALVVSQLTAAIRSRALKAEDRKDRSSRLIQFCRAILGSRDKEVDVTRLAREIRRIFEAEYCAIHVPDRDGRWKHVALGKDDEPSQIQPPDFTPLNPAGAMQPTTVGELADKHGIGIMYAYGKIDSKITCALALKSKHIDRETMDSAADLVALTLQHVENS